jgi:hypothetical protein
MKSETLLGASSSENVGWAKDDKQNGMGGDTISLNSVGYDDELMESLS